MKNSLHFITAIFVFLLLVLGCNDQGQNTSNTTKSTPENYSVVEAADLSISYHSNEVSADNSYNGKTFFIVGQIKDIGKTITGAPYVILKGDPILKTPVDIQVIFERSEKDKIAKLTRGKTIKAKGTCNGMTLGNVILSDGELR